MGLYELAKSLGLHLTYEFDGCGVMCREDDPEVLAKINQLSRHIQEHGERLWGIRPVLVVKTAEGEAVNPHNPATNRKSGAAEVKPGPPPSMAPFEDHLLPANGDFLQGSLDEHTNRETSG